MPEENKRYFSAGDMQEPPNPLAGLIQALPGGVSPSFPISQIKAKLPKLVLPKFRGDATTWMGFWDSYKSAVHDNVSLSKIDKFNYLRSLLDPFKVLLYQATIMIPRWKYSSNDLAKHNRSSPQTWKKF